MPITLLAILLKLPEKISYIIKIAELYFIIALTGTITIAGMDTFTTDASKIAIAFIGTFFIFIYYASSAYQKEKQTLQELNLPAILDGFNFDYIIAYCSIPAFIVILFIPQLALTAPVTYFLKAFDWIYNIHIIVAWGLSIYGFIMAINWILNGFLYITVIIAYLFSKISQLVGSKTKKEGTAMDNNNDWIFAKLPNWLRWILALPVALIGSMILPAISKLSLDYTLGWSDGNIIIQGMVMLASVSGFVFGLLYCVPKFKAVISAVASILLSMSFAVLVVLSIVTYGWTWDSTVIVNIVSGLTCVYFAVHILLNKEEIDYTHINKETIDL